MVNKMIELSRANFKDVQGAGSWDDFWKMIGEAIGSAVAEDAYSKESKVLHDLGSNGGLDEFLENQSDPLL